MGNFALTALLLCSAPDLSPQWVVSARTGVSAPAPLEGALLSPGGAVGADAELAFLRHLAFSLSADVAFHPLRLGTEQLAGLSTRLSPLASVRYRLDVTDVVPYAGVGVGPTLLFHPRVQSAVSLGGALELGAYWALAEALHGQLSLRYALSPDGQVGSGFHLMLGFGWRSGPF